VLMALCDGSDARVDSIVLRHDAADAPGIACFEVNKQFCKRKQRSTLSRPRRTRMHNSGGLLSLFAVSCQCTRRVCPPNPNPFPRPIFPAPSPFPAPCIFYAALHFDLAGLCLLVRYS